MRTKRAQTLRLAVLAVTVTVPMTACGGSSQPAAKIGVASGPSATTDSPTPTTASTTSATSSSSPSVASTSSSLATTGLPDLTLPADVKLQFNLPKVSDPSQNAALQALVQVEKAMYKATETGATSGPLVNDFFSQDGVFSVEKYLDLKQSNNTTVTGTNVYYNWKFPASTADQKVIQITYCEDQNKFLDKNRATGQPVAQQPGLTQIYSFKVDMMIGKDGRWKAAYYNWKQGDTACQAAERH